ncbi:unnamed protein product [Rhizoctonia solani]|uniref:Carboxylesterase type B domain-containing protein n=1 Tax=Rhizoctonia solani TaxID=456999 RepID=A0A8H3DNV4_9AGAM|nr:unnamed protein product [Rhizoctonia solani]
MPSLAFWTRAILSFGGAIASAQTTGPTIKGNGVTYVGGRNSTGGTDYFLSVPFAKPPTGALRFKPPVAWTPTGSNPTINATIYGPSCPQGISDFPGSTSEDCLTVDIWKPSNITEKLPVMVWIYGGGFYFGTSQGYEGWYMVQPSVKAGKPFIYVALNYRTGIFGFPPGTESAKAGALNLGLKDQRLALEWVQKNIGYFGGDSKKASKMNVHLNIPDISNFTGTIFGESAGAISCAYQSMYKGGNIGGAFRGMILESGSPSSVNVAPANDPIQQQAYQFVVNATGCTGSAKTFECLRNAPSDVLQKANQDVLKVPDEWKGEDQGPVVLGPVLAPGDVFLSELPSVSIRAGRFAKVPFINGAVLDEGTIFLNPMTPQTEKNVTDWLLYQAPGLYYGYNNLTAVTELLKFYPTDPAAGSPYGTGNETFGKAAQYKRLASVNGDLVFQASRRDHVRVATKAGVPVWSYLFAATFNTLLAPLDPAADYPRKGIQHTSEIAFVFRALSVSGLPIPRPYLQLEDATFNYWLNFAYTLNLNPTTGTYPYWPKYGNNATLLELGLDIHPIPDTFRAEAIEYIIKTPSLYN